MREMRGVMLKALSETAQDVLVELWELDLRPLGGEIHRFCNQVNAAGGVVVWQGRSYQAYPCVAEGFEMRSVGSGNRPRLTVSNLFGLVTGLSARYGQLAGAEVVRRLTYARFLDAVNFTNGNPSADSTQEAVERYTVEQLASLTAETAVLELAAPSESDGAAVPSRVMLADTCVWQYRGEGCGYTGRAVADRFDMPTSDATKDMCSGTLTGCRARFGMTAVLPFGGFPGADKVG